MIQATSYTSDIMMIRNQSQDMITIMISGYQTLLLPRTIFQVILFGGEQWSSLAANLLLGTT